MAQITIDRELEQRLTEAITEGFLSAQCGQEADVAEWLAPEHEDTGIDTNAYLTMAILRRLRLNGFDNEAIRLETALFERTCARKS